MKTLAVCLLMGLLGAVFAMDRVAAQTAPETGTQLITLGTTGGPLPRALFPQRERGILWTIIIDFVAGIIAKFLHPGPNEPSGFIPTTILGIVGALVATYLGRAIGGAPRVPSKGRTVALRVRRCIWFLVQFSEGRSKWPDHQSSPRCL